MKETYLSNTWYQSSDHLILRLKIDRMITVFNIPVEKVFWKVTSSNQYWLVILKGTSNYRWWLVVCMRCTESNKKSNLFLAALHSNSSLKVQHSKPSIVNKRMLPLDIKLWCECSTYEDFNPSLDALRLQVSKLFWLHINQSKF